ncbi:MAG: sugar phosphate isomerase/epimerase family protein [Cyclobacteriaceae bacterium]
MIFSRRYWLKTLLATPLVSFPGAVVSRAESASESELPFRLSLNAYSFNRLLFDGDMSLDQLLDFTADHYIPALDLTAYYFPTYPEVPDDTFLYEVKRKAHRRGLVFSGTGVRNNFTQPDAEKRAKDVQLVRNWIDAAVKLGAPVVRIFAGPEAVDGALEEETMNWMIEAIRECVKYGEQRGIIVALQNHNEFVKTAAQVHQIMRSIPSDWFGLMLDIGSYRTADPYAEIKETIPYAVNWQIKEDVYQGGEAQKTDLPQLFQLIWESGYRGYLPLETLGPGDPYQKVSAFLAEARAALHGLG